MAFFLDEGSHFLKCHVRYWTWDRICSGHPALYRQLAGLDSNPEPSSLWFAEAEISAQGSQLQAVASSPGSLGSPHLCCSNLPKLGKVLYSGAGAPSLPRFITCLLPASPKLSLPPCSSCLFVVALQHYPRGLIYTPMFFFVHIVSLLPVGSSVPSTYFNSSRS